MKKLTCLLIASFLFITLAACSGNTASPPANDVTIEQQTQSSATTQPSEDSFTIEQLQRAMLPQFLLGNDTDILEHQVISAQRVEREEDYVWFEPGGEYLDASNAVRYRLEIRHRELHIEWHPIGDGFYDSEEVIGDFITRVMYRDFNIVDGEPELLYVVC